MQHLDEGTIHSWLDSALNADEAARVEAHVAECPQCAGAVAEARGFIAASSRILTALDNAPRGVMPVAAPRKRVDPLVWRVAATVLVVAAGTLVVVRNQGSDRRPTSAAADHAPMLSQPTSLAESVSTAAGPVAAPANGASPKAAASNPPTIARGGVSAERTTARVGQTDTTGAVAQTAQTFAPLRVAGVAAMDAASEPEPLKVVSSPRRIGQRVTLYEVAPGDTVTLTESTPTSLNSIVLRGAVGAQMTRQAAEKSAAAPSKSRADAAIAPVPESQPASGVAAAALAASAPAPSQVGLANTPHTITWTDPATGNTLTLTGRMPEARLQEIKIRIDRERAAAAAKKNP